jgi:hypothetical protein
LPLTWSESIEIWQSCDGEHMMTSAHCDKSFEGNYPQNKGKAIASRKKVCQSALISQHVWSAVVISGYRNWSILTKYIIYTFLKCTKRLISWCWVTFKLSNFFCNLNEWIYLFTGVNLPVYRRHRIQFIIGILRYNGIKQLHSMSRQKKVAITF